MNAYFWFFALCAFLMTPVTVHTGIYFSQSVHWELQVKAAGVVLARRQKHPGKKATAGMLTSRRKLLWTFAQDGTLGRLLRLFSCEELYVHARLSFQDAALTALSYTMARTLLETLQRCRALPGKAFGRLEADFQAQGSSVEIHGIFSARMGKIILACIQLTAAMLRTKSKLAMKEDTYAAASH